MENSPNADVIVVGAGLAGLAAAVAATERGQTVIALERSGRPGGVVETGVTDGFMFEWGPNTVQSTPELFRFLRALRLDGEALLAPARTPRFILKNGRLHAAPLSPLSLMTTPLLSPAARLRLLAEPFVARGGAPEESLADFGRRRLGRAAVDHLLSPFVSGVWAGDPEQLRAASAFPRLTAWERDHGSVIGGAIRTRSERDPKTPRGLISFREGLETIPRRVAAVLGESLRLNTGVQRIDRNPSGGWRVDTDRGALNAPNLVLAAPADVTAELIRPLDADAASALDGIPYAPLAVLQMAAATSAVAHPLGGFGYLTTPKDDPFVLGCLWSSSLFPGRAPAGQALFTVFVGGARHPERIDLGDGALADGAAADLRAALDMREPPRLLALRRYRRAIPQYVAGHADRERRVRAAEGRQPGLRFAGNYLGGISVGDVIKTGLGR